MSIHSSFIKRTPGKTLLLSALAFSTLSAFNYQPAAAPDFSGEWKLNEAKSELGEFGARVAPKTMKVTGGAEGLTIEKTGTGFQGEAMVNTEKLSFDGKETESTMFGTSKKKSSTKWAEDGQALNVTSVLHFERDGQTTDISMTETWKLINDGQSILIDQKSTSTWGENAMKLVYDKVAK